MKSFDLIVIGGGPGGYIGAIRAAQQGLKTALIEERDLGGTCLNRGCIPTKALMHASHLYHQMKESEIFGIQTGGISYDMQAIYSRKNQVVEQLRDGVEGLLKANGVSCYLQGRAKLLDQGRVEVIGGEEEALLHGENILLATGAAPARPPIPGMDLPGVITSDELLDGEPLDCKSLVVIGGGVIGMEVATVYANLGAAVTVIEAAERILPHMDREIAQNLSMILKKRGVTLHTASTVEKIEAGEQGLVVTFSGKKGEEQARGEAVLAAVGRKANTKNLLAEGLTLEEDRGITINHRFQTSLPGVYAIGDCTSNTIQLAHVASAQAANAVAIIAGKEPPINLQVVPGCVYTDPEIATVGLSAQEAKEQGIPVETSKYIMSGNGKSILENQERGFVKLVFHAEKQTLLGAQLMCGRATDLVGELASAIANGLTAKDLEKVIHPHPTFSEGILEGVEELFGTAPHVTPKRKPK